MARLKSELQIKFVKTHLDAVIPITAHAGDAGFDLYAVDDRELKPGTVTPVPTGLVLAEFPPEDEQGNQLFFDIRSRSGLSKKGIFPITGTVDAIYRGEILVLLANMSGQAHYVCKGERIAQFVIQKIVTNSENSRVILEEVKEITPTERGASGFGSTGA